MSRYLECFVECDSTLKEFNINLSLARIEKLINDSEENLNGVLWQIEQTNDGSEVDGEEFFGVKTICDDMDEEIWIYGINDHYTTVRDIVNHHNMCVLHLLIAQKLTI